jgi:hypothetical protein
MESKKITDCDLIKSMLMKAKLPWLKSKSLQDPWIIELTIENRIVPAGISCRNSKW